METLSLHIDYLLRHHDCVTLPGVGALLVHGVPPCYDERTGRWTAPSRVVSFNSDINRTDGLLARSVARREGISHRQAVNTVERGVAELRRRLDANAGVALGHAGRLSRSSEGRLSFEPSADWAKSSPAVMWLPDVEAPVCRTAGAQIPGTMNYEPSRRRRALSLVGRAAACIAVIMALGWVVADNLRSGNSEQYASVAPVETSALIERPGEASAPIVWLMKHHDDAVVEVEPKPESCVITEAPGYYLVVASLADRKEADGFMARYPGQKFGILLADGRYRVFTHKAATAAELYSVAAGAGYRSEFPSSWVCRR